MARRKKKKDEEENKKEEGLSQEELIAAISKKVEGAELLDRQTLLEQGFISTSNLAINYICSGLFIDGGVPRGRVTEIFGPSSSAKTVIATHILQGCQKMNGISVLLDTESAYSPKFAETLGIDSNKLIYMQPDHLEDCFGKTEEIAMLVASKGSKQPVCVVYDSIAASPSGKEFNDMMEGKTSGPEMGLRARICSQELRKISSFLNRQNCAFVIINQIRMKIGVMFGCFHYDSRVVLADGTTEKIGKIVNQKLPVEVLTFDDKTGQVSKSKIINWFDNGNTDRFLQFTTEKAGGNGSSRFGVTGNHLISTPNGDVPAGELRIGDKVLGLAKKQFSNMMRQIAIGSTLGDGSIRMISVCNSQVRFCHGEKQIEYAQWKASLFGDSVAWTGKTENGWGFETSASFDMTDVYKEAYGEDKRQMSNIVLKELDLLGVAIWYMDDGTFSGSYEKWGHGKSEISSKSYTEEEREMLAERLVEMGLPRPTVSARGFCWSGKSCGKFQEMIAQYIYPSMDYKIHPSLRGQFEELKEGHIVERYVLTPVKILDIYEKPKTRIMKRFDLGVEGQHRYFVDGVGVHNSPETTAGGGNSLEFYCSIRLDCRKKKVILDGRKRPIGIFLSVKNVKNKIHQPFGRADQLRLYWDYGIDPCSGLLQILIDTDRIKPGSPGWYHLATDENVKFQAKKDDNYVQPKFLLEHPEVIDATTEQVEEFLHRNRTAVEATRNTDAEVDDETEEDA